MNWLNIPRFSSAAYLSCEYNITIPCSILKSCLISLMLERKSSETQRDVHTTNALSVVKLSEVPYALLEESKHRSDLEKAMRKDESRRETKLR